MKDVDGTFGVNFVQVLTAAELDEVRSGGEPRPEIQVRKEDIIKAIDEGVAPDGERCGNLVPGFFRAITVTDRYGNVMTGRDGSIMTTGPHSLTTPEGIQRGEFEPVDVKDPEVKIEPQVGLYRGNKY